MWDYTCRYIFKKVLKEINMDVVYQYLQAFMNLNLLFPTPNVDSEREISKSTKIVFSSWWFHITIDYFLYFLFPHFDVEIENEVWSTNRSVFQVLLNPSLVHAIQPIYKTTKLYPFSINNNSHHIQATLTMVRTKIFSFCQQIPVFMSNFEDS